jgi:hypothetical protein
MSAESTAPAETAAAEPAPPEPPPAIVPAPPPVPCANCGAPVPEKYCGQCGEPRLGPRQDSLWALLGDALHDFFHLEGKLLRTVKALVTRPGLLTAEYFAGRRKHYARPFALFIVANVVFFLIQPHTNLFNRKLGAFMDQDAGWREMVEHKLARTNEPLERYRARFDTALEGQRKSTLVVLVPLFALLARALHWRRDSYYVRHLVFSIHFFAFFLLYQALALLPALLALAFVGLDNEVSTLVLLLLGAMPYLYFGLRRVHQDGKLAALGRTAVLTMGLGVLFKVFDALAFLGTFYGV